VQLSAGGERLTEPVATAPQSKALHGTNAVVVVIFPAPDRTASPEIEALCRMSPHIHKIKIDQSWFPCDHYVVFGLGDVHPDCFRTGPSRGGSNFKGISQGVLRSFRLTPPAFKPRLFSAVQSHVGKHWRSAYHDDRCDATVFPDFESQLNIASDVCLPGQWWVLGAKKAHDNNLAFRRWGRGGVARTRRCLLRRRAKVRIAQLFSHSYSTPSPLQNPPAFHMPWRTTRDFLR
jgi:hypothetical protein